MKKSASLALAVILLGLLTLGAWADCKDETNPECYLCRSNWFIGSWCSIVTGDEVGHCSCESWSLNGHAYCNTWGEFCGMILVVG